MLLKLSDALARISLAACRIGSWLILPLILIIMFDVITRKWVAAQQFLANSPLGTLLSATRLQEMEWHLHAAIFLLAFGAALIRNTHVRVDIWREKRSTRTQGWVELGGLLLLSLPFVSLMVWLSWQFVMKAYVSGEGSAALTGIPQRWIVKSFMILGFGLLWLALVSTLLRILVFLFGTSSARAAAATRLPQINAPLLDLASGRPVR